MSDDKKESLIKNIRIQLCDYLFERGHSITKPMVDDAADFVYTYATSWYEQGKMAVKSKEQP